MYSLRTKLLLGYGIVLSLSVAEFVSLCLGHVRLAEWLLLVELVLGVIFLVYLTRVVFLPIHALTRATDEIRAGVRNELGLKPGRDEVGRLARSINEMAAAEREALERAREQLLRSEEATSSVLNSLSHAVAVISPEGTIEIVNRHAQKFGLETGRDVRATGHKWLPPLVQEVRQSRAAGPRHTVAPVQVFDGGSEKFFLPQASPVISATGELIGITVVLADVTEERQVTEAKSGLISSVSHQLKTPMTSIQMSIHLLLEDNVDRLTARQRELLQAACDDSERLHRQIEELLEAARKKG
jgi:signal transduction histidine kinase